MKANSSIKDSHTDLEKLKNLKDSNIDLSEIPEITEEFLSEANIRFKGTSLSKKKVRINILLDEPIVAYYKTLANGRGYQTLINEALKQSVMQEEIEVKLRKIIREELKTSR
jgi:uncharacterized protein (DUF4415 family)